MIRLVLKIGSLALAVVACGTSAVTPTPTPEAPTPTGTAVPARTALPSATKTALATAAATPTASTSITRLFAGGFSALTFVANAGDGSGDLYVVEQAGRIFKVDGGGSVPASPWLDISDRISSGGERGLLGLAFHPDFASNGRFFVDYTDTQGNSVISEFAQASDDTVDPGSERVLLTQHQPFPNHNGGMLAFGPDGDLYIGFGDGGSGGDPQGNGQKLSTFLGKILRIDVDAGDPYAIPKGNPFGAGNAQGALPEIWDWGVRNPWRFSFDRVSGGLFIGDVGQDQTEEVDVERAALGSRNYGWNIMEGDHCYQATTCNERGLTMPVATYGHDLGCSVIGGYVYRGAQFPDLVGRYFYADLCSGRVWTLDAEAALSGSPVSPELFGRVPFSVTSFGEDEAGELYIVDGSGTVYRLGES